MPTGNGAAGRPAGYSTLFSDAAIEVYIDMIQTYLMHNKEIRDRVEHNPGLVREITMLFLDGLIRGKE